MIRSVYLTVSVILEVLKLSIPGGTQVQWKKSAEIRRHRSIAGAQIRRTRSAEVAEGRRQLIGRRAHVRRKTVRHSAHVRRDEVGYSAYLYAAVIWVKLRTSLEIYFAVHVYHYWDLGFEVMSDVWYHVLVTAVWKVIDYIFMWYDELDLVDDSHCICIDLVIGWFRRLFDYVLHMVIGSSMKIGWNVALSNYVLCFSVSCVKIDETWYLEARRL